MKFISQSLSALLLGGGVGLFFRSAAEGIDLIGVPSALIGTSFGILVGAWFAVIVQKGDIEHIKGATAAFVTVVLGFPVVWLFTGEAVQPTDDMLFDPRLLLPVMKWVMIGGLFLSMLLCFVSLWQAGKRLALPSKIRPSDGTE